MLAGLLLLPFASAAAPQEPVAPPPLSAEQELRLSGLPPDIQLFERFRPTDFGSGLSRAVRLCAMKE